jgi:CHAT domain-containing protein
MDALGDRIAAARTACDLGGWERSLGRPAEALRLASRALETPLALGIGLGDATCEGLRGDARAAADVGLLAAFDLAAADPSRREELCREAFRLSESSRGLSIAEGFLNRDALFDAYAAASTRADDAAARDRVAALRNHLAALAVRPETDAATLSKARDELDAAYRSLAESTARVQRDARRVADLVYPWPERLDLVQAALPEDCALAVYHLTAERAFVLAVTRASARLVDLGPASPLEDAARDYVDVVSVDGADDARKSAALYDRLLRPIEPETAGRARIVVSPDGPLAFVPFDALIRASDGRRERVVERWTTTCVPSATVWRVTSADASGAKDGAVVALGDPTYGEDACPGALLHAYGRLRRLPGTAAEVRAIAEIAGPERCTTLLGGDATSRGLADAVARAGGKLAELHLACHGRIDAERPRLTGLALAGGEILSVDDICRMRVPADVVVLSACDSGHGPVLRGEGVMGLARAFFFAGASRVVVSDWAVSDEAASELMVAFAKRLLRDRLPAREALRAAKLSLLRGRTELAHPASWAAFVIWGD